jgi:hypothetical protein
MNGVQYALRRVHHGENEAVKDLMRLAERHRVEHEVHHVCRDLASWSKEHVTLLARHAADYDLDLDDDADAPDGAASHLREVVATALGRRSEPGLLLLEDLRHLYLRTAENSLAWEMLAQIAQARRQRDLLALTEKCHPRTLRQVRWANTTIKTQAPQILSSL